MKKNKLFEQCLAKVNPDTREEVRRNMEIALGEGELTITAKVNGNEYRIGGKITKDTFERVLDKCVKVITIAIKEKEKWI